MSTQTKLTVKEKNELWHMTAWFESSGGRMFQNPDAGVTVAVLPHFPGAVFAKLSVAYCGDTESKFRRKVGQFLALTRLDTNQCISLPLDIAMETAFLLTE